MAIVVKSRKLVGILILVFGLAVFAIIVWSVWAFPVSSRGIVETSAKLPATFTPDHLGGAKALGGLILDKDGKAKLLDFPVGEVGSEGDTPCLIWDGASTYTGHADWYADEHLFVTITTGAGGTVVAPYRPPFGDVVWDRFGVPMCPGSGKDLWYWVE